MATKRELLGNELVSEIARIRIDTLWNMLALKAQDRLPAIDAEKATGDLDDKGAIFLPGGIVFQDWEGNPIKTRRLREPSAEVFRRHVREAMRHDGAHLFYPDAFASRVKLGNSSFASVASRILGNKREALRRSRGLGPQPARIYSAEISKSYCPNWIPAPYGSRTALSSDLSACLTEPRMYFRQCLADLSLRGPEAEEFWQSIRNSKHAMLGKDGITLAPPCIVTCHSTRYREGVLTGITRISGYGRFGEFATLTMEQIGAELLNEVGVAQDKLSTGDIVADYGGVQVAAVLRIYPRTNPGARLMKGISASLINTPRELGIDLARVETEAKKRYRID